MAISQCTVFVTSVFNQVPVVSWLPCKTVSIYPLYMRSDLITWYLSIRHALRSPLPENSEMRSCFGFLNLWRPFRMPKIEFSGRLWLTESGSSMHRYLCTFPRKLGCWASASADIPQSTLTFPTVNGWFILEVRVMKFSLESYLFIKMIFTNDLRIGNSWLGSWHWLVHSLLLQSKSPREVFNRIQTLLRWSSTEYGNPKDSLSY